MNEQERYSQVSALFDGELDSAQAELVTRRLLKDPSLRESWGRYALVGASLRGDPLSVGHGGRGDVAARVRLAMEREAALTGSGAEAGATGSPRSAPAWRTMALGSALAAGVATVAILVMRAQAPGTPELVASTMPSPAVSAAAQDAVAPAPAAARLRSSLEPAPSYTTPVDLRPTGPRSSTPLANYVVAHSEYTTPMVRLSPLSAVITGNFDPTENTVEMTEAEVGARR